MSYVTVKAKAEKGAFFMENSTTEHGAKEDRRGLHLPKNIRQIGNMQGLVRIYMEDYVYTYLHGSGRAGWAHRGSIFLGGRQQGNGQKYIFISGLVRIPDEAFTDGVPEFTDLIWGGIYQEMKQFYEDVEILGWGMDVSGASAKLTSDLEHIHRNAFQGQDKLIFLMDSLEKEEAFYVYEKNMLRRRDGYYVYYEKNPEMQEYMMQGKTGQEQKPEVDPQQSVVTSYRAITAENSKKSGRGFRAFVYAASLALLVAVSAMGVNMISNIGKINRLEETLSFLETDKTQIESEVKKQPEKTDEEEKTDDALKETPDDTSDVQADDTAEPGVPSDGDDEKVTDDAPENESGEEDTPDDNAGPSVEPRREEPEEEPEEDTQETTAFAGQEYYVVQKGESLLSISQKIYGADYTDELCELNELEDANKIYAGQKLLLLDK